MPVQRIESNPRMSAAVIHADLVFLAGQVPDDRGLDAAGTDPARITDCP